MIFEPVNRVDVNTPKGDGIIWLITAVVGSIFIFLGKPIDQLLLLATGVAGGLGVLLKD